MPRARSALVTTTAQAPSVSVPPGTSVGVPPAAITEVVNPPKVRAPASLTPAARAPEADHGRELGPIDWVEVAVLRSDRHLGSRHGAAMRSSVAGPTVKLDLLPRAISADRNSSPNFG